MASHNVFEGLSRFMAVFYLYLYKMIRTQVCVPGPQSLKDGSEGTIFIPLEARAGSGVNGRHIQLATCLGTSATQFRPRHQQYCLGCTHVQLGVPSWRAVVGRGVPSSCVECPRFPFTDTTRMATPHPPVLRIAFLRSPTPGPHQASEFCPPQPCCPGF